MHLPITHYKRIIHSIFANPNGWENDILVFKYNSFLRSFSSILMRVYPIKMQTMYRGILLGSKHRIGDTIPAIKERAYTSFSTSKSSAKDFADPSSPLAIFLNLQGKSNGFLIEHSSLESEILFHHSWGEAMNIYTDFYEGFKCQKEVTLFNDIPSFVLRSTNE